VAHFPSAEECAKRLKDRQSRQRYPADLTDEPWAIGGPRLPPAKPRPRGGRPRTVDMRAVLHPSLSWNRSGGHWPLRRHDLRPQRTVSDALAQGCDDGTWAGWVKALRERHRVEAGRAPTPRAACLASPSVKTTELGGPERGYAGGKKIKGRQRPLWLDPPGLLMAIVMTSAGLDEGVAALTVLGHVTPQDGPRLVTSLADQPYHHHHLEAWRAEPRAGGRLEVQTRPTGMKGCTPLAKRWVMARTNAWPGRSRRPRKDSERSIASRTALSQMRPIHLLLNSLAPGGRLECHDRQEAA
jgi:putative transposase